MASSFDTVKFDLPDGQVELCSWNYIVSRLSEVVNAARASIVEENISLTQIETKLQSWIDEQD